MEPVLYFYSIDGGNTCGPVTEDALRQLLKDKVIGPASFICPQGEAQWKPLDLEWLRRAPPQAPKLPAYEPPPYVPTGTAKEREEERVLQFEEKWNAGPYPELFQWGSLAFAGVASIVMAIMQDGIQNILAGLLGGVVFMGLIPYLISTAFKQAWRLRAWAIATAVFTGLTFAGQAAYTKLMGMDVSIAASPNPVPVAATPTEPARPTADLNPEEVARMVQALQPVQQEMVDKVKASDAAEKACGNFDPATLTSQAQLATLRDGIHNLHAAQADVLTYFRTYDDRCRTVLAGGGFTSDGIERFVAGVHQKAHIDQAAAIWQLRIKLTDDHLVRLDFLDKRWGNWQPKDGQIVFANQADLDTYNQLTQDLILDIKQGNQLQQQAAAK